MPEEKPPKFDRKRPYGVVMGDPKIAYEQDGHHYSHSGELIETWTTPQALANELVVRERQVKKEAKTAARVARTERERLIKEEIG